MSEDTNTAASALLDSLSEDQDTEIADPVNESTEVEANTESATNDPASEDNDIRVDPYIPPIREDAAAQLALIEQEMKALGTKLDEGEIETEAYHEALIKLTDTRTQIQIEQALAEQAARAAEHADRNAWGTANQRFLAANPGYQDMTRQEPLAAIARMVMADEANRNRSPDWILNEAKRRLESAFAPSSDAPRTEADIKASAKAKASAIKAPTPMSLSDIPGAPGAAATEFERLDQAGSGFNKIDTLMSLPPDKLEAWMNRRI